jgi:uncharacterized protein with von Willebrand factor type A (vWA) domain
LPNFHEKVEDYFKKQREELEKQEKLEQEKKEKKAEEKKKKQEEKKRKMKIGKKHKRSLEISESNNVEDDIEDIKMVDGLAIDIRDKKKLQREMVKLKAEYSYNR